MDSVQRLRDGVHGPGHVPHDQHGGERDERGRVALEDLPNGEVDSVEDGLRQVGLERRRDRVRPDVLEPEDTQEREAEQRQRDERDERPVRDRRGVRQEAVLGEARGDVLHRVAHAARANRKGSRRHGLSLPRPRRRDTRPRAAVP